MKVCVWSSLCYLGAAFATNYKIIYLLWVASTLNHLGYKWIHTPDKILAHAICLRSMQTIPWALSGYVFLYWLCWFWALYIYYISGLSHKNDYWHASIHAGTSIGMVSHSMAHASSSSEPLLLGTDRPAKLSN